MSNQNGYIGRSPGDSAVIIASQTFEPTGIQTDFTFASGYDPGYIDVYFNGARLVYANDYTATNGSTVGLTTYANNGDVLELVAYKAFNVGAVSDATGNFTVGQDLTVTGDTTATDINAVGIVTATGGIEVGVAGVGGTIAANGNTTLAGVLTATSFSGDGSGLTGVASTDNIITGVAVTIGGILRVTDTTQSTSSTTGAVIVSGGVGIAKSLHVGGNISVGGTLTYEDVTNVDVLGLSTFRSGVQFGVAGVGGTIAANGNTTLAGVVTATTFVGAVTGSVTATSSPAITIRDGASEKGYIGFTGNDPFIGRKDGVGLSFQNNKVRPVDGDDGSPSNNTVDIGEPTYKFKDLYLAGNANIAGAASTFSGNLNVGSAVTVYGSSGIVSATSYYGDGSNLEGVSASGGGAIDITSCLFI